MSAVELRPARHGNGIEFADRYGCLISMVEYYDQIDLIVKGSMGPAHGMLTRDHAAALWPLLQRFAETGRLARLAEESEATQ